MVHRIHSSARLLPPEPKLLSETRHRPTLFARIRYWEAVRDHADCQCCPSVARKAAELAEVNRSLLSKPSPDATSPCPANEKAPA